jgi:hypothetical protein
VGTYDTRGGTPRHDPVSDHEPVIYPEEERVLAILEQAGVATSVCDQVVGVVHELAEREAGDDQSEEVVPQRFRCWLRSAPGMWAQYDGSVDVWARDVGDVFARAVQQLAHTSFPDRPSLSSWRLERIECLPGGGS